MKKEARSKNVRIIHVTVEAQFKIFDITQGGTIS